MTSSDLKNDSFNLPAPRAERGRLAAAFAFAVSLHVGALAAVVVSKPEPFGYDGQVLDAIEVSLIDGAALEQRAAIAEPQLNAPAIDAADAAGAGTLNAAESAAAQGKAEPAQDAHTAAKPAAAIETAAIEPAPVFALPLPEIVLPVEPPVMPQASPAASPESRAAVSGGTPSRGDASVPGSKPAASGAPPGVTRAYAQSVAAALQASKPAAVGARGSVQVGFTIGATGQLDRLDLVLSSGNGRLDDAVLASIRRARFQTPPESMTAAQRSFVLPFVFR